MYKPLIFPSFVILLFLAIPCSSYSQSASQSGHEDWEYALEEAGDFLQLALPITAGVTTLIIKDYEGTKQFAFSYATTLALTYALKYVCHKQRPEHHDQYDSFPSGHTSSAFSGASFIQRRYGWKYGWIAYVLAGIVAISRTEGPEDYHDYWDVLGGAAIGIGSTYIFTKPYEKPSVEVSFTSGNKNYLISLNYRF